MKQLKVDPLQGVRVGILPQVNRRLGFVHQEQIWKVQKFPGNCLFVHLAAAGQGNPVEIPVALRRQNPLQSGHRVGPGLHLQIVKPHRVQAHRLHLGFRLQGHDAHALVPGFVPASAHRTAGPDAQPAPCPEGAGLVDMSQCQIVEAGFPNLGDRHRAAGGFPLGRVAMEHADAVFFRPLGVEALQQGRAVHTAVACAVDPAVQVFQRHRFQSAGEDMHIFRPAFLHPGAARGDEIVVARGDEYRHRAAVQGLLHILHRLPARLRGVKDISRQEHQVAALPEA